MFIDLKEGTRETSICCLPYVPQPGIQPITQVCALRIKPQFLWCVGGTPTEPLS